MLHCLLKARGSLSNVVKITPRYQQLPRYKNTRSNVSLYEKNMAEYRLSIVDIRPEFLQVIHTFVTLFFRCK
jgi:hypothetical protein